MERINILFIIDTLVEVGGTEKHLLQLVNGLNKTRFSCAICTFKWGENAVTAMIRKSKIPILVLSMNKICSYRGLREGLKLLRLIKGFKPDIFNPVVSNLDYHSHDIAT